jgi:hypothetical protein
LRATAKVAAVAAVPAAILLKLLLGET